MTAKTAEVTPARAFMAARIVAGALLVSSIVLASVGVYLTLSEAVPATGGGSTVLFWLWVVAAFLGTAGWYALWQRAKALAESPEQRRELGGGLLAARLVQRLVAGWALLESQMIVAFVASLLSGTPMLLAPGFVIMALGILLSSPRREWFTPLEQAGGAEIE